MTQMNLSTALFLMTDELRAVMCAYEEVPEKGSSTPMPKLTMFKTLDKTIKVGDIVLVPSHTRHKVTTTKVVEVDVEVDCESQTKVDWIVGKVDRALGDKYVAFELATIDKIKAAQKAKKKRELKDALLKDVPDGENITLDVAQLTALPASVGSTPSQEE